MNTSKNTTNQANSDIQNDISSYLKDRYDLISNRRSLEFKNELMEKTGWSKAVWHFKLHGKTKISPSEKMVIIKIYHHYVELMAKDNESV